MQVCTRHALEAWRRGGALTPGTNALVAAVGAAVVVDAASSERRCLLAAGVDELMSIATGMYCAQRLTPSISCARTCRPVNDDDDTSTTTIG